MFSPQALCCLIRERVFFVWVICRRLLPQLTVTVSETNMSPLFYCFICNWVASDICPSILQWQRNAMHLLNERMQTLGSGSRGSATAARQFISKPHRNKQPFTPKLAPIKNLEFTVDLTGMFLDCLQKVENPAETPADPGEYLNSKYLIIID